jgi:hypothetical protein
MLWAGIYAQRSDYIKRVFSAYPCEVCGSAGTDCELQPVPPFRSGEVKWLHSNCVPVFLTNSEIGQRLKAEGRPVSIWDADEIIELSNLAATLPSNR